MRSSIRESVAVVLFVLMCTAAGRQLQGDEIAPQETIRELQQRIARLEKQVDELRQLVDRQRPSTWEQEIQEVGMAPGPISSTGIPVTGDTRLEDGQVLQVLWGNSWWAAKVLRTLDNGSVSIHYLGWQSQFDEVVSRTRLQWDPDAVAKARGTRMRYVQHRVVVAPRNPGSITPGPIRVIDNTRLNTGDAVDVQWGSSWWRGEVLALLSDGRVSIHYFGWGSASDEAVARSRLRLSADPGADARGRQ